MYAVDIFGITMWRESTRFNTRGDAMARLRYLQACGFTARVRVVQ